jgi:hypothetical protein
MRISRAMSFNQQQPRKFRQLPRPQTLAGGCSLFYGCAGQPLVNRAIPPLDAPL